MLSRFKYVMQDNSTFLNWVGISRAMIMLIRGVVPSIRLKRLVLLGPRAQIEGARYVAGQGVIKAEQDVLIQGTSFSGVFLGNGVSFGAFSQLRPSSQYGGVIGEGCVIGDGTTFGPFAYIGCAGRIRIGRNCMFGPRVSIMAENHQIPPRGLSLKDAGVIRKGIVIGEDCWIGANVVILDGSTIGDGSVIGAGAVVRGDIPAYSIAVGVPAKVIKSR